jgi:hypothetical protein
MSRLHSEKTNVRKERNLSLLHFLKRGATDKYMKMRALFGPSVLTGNINAERK